MKVDFKNIGKHDINRCCGCGLMLVDGVIRRQHWVLIDGKRFCLHRCAVYYNGLGYLVHQTTVCRECGDRFPTSESDNEVCPYCSQDYEPEYYDEDEEDDTDF